MQAMVAGDPSARWIMQAWLFFNEGFFWKPPQIQAPPTTTTTLPHTQMHTAADPVSALSILIGVSSKTKSSSRGWDAAPGIFGEVESSFHAKMPGQHVLSCLP